jgi:hypothetical protein
MTATFKRAGAASAGNEAANVLILTGAWCPSRLIRRTSLPSVRRRHPCWSPSMRMDLWQAAAILSLAVDALDGAARDLGFSCLDAPDSQLADRQRQGT